MGHRGCLCAYEEQSQTNCINQPKEKLMFMTLRSIGHLTHIFPGFLLGFLLPTSVSPLHYVLVHLNYPCKSVVQLPPSLWYCIWLKNTPVKWGWANKHEFTAPAWRCWYETAVTAIWVLFFWHFHFIFNCTVDYGTYGFILHLPNGSLVVSWWHFLLYLVLNQPKITVTFYLEQNI